MFQDARLAAAPVSSPSSSTSKIDKDAKMLIDCTASLAMEEKSVSVLSETTSVQSVLKSYVNGASNVPLLYDTVGERLRLAAEQRCMFPTAKWSSSSAKESGRPTHSFSMTQKNSRPALSTSASRRATASACGARTPTNGSSASLPQASPE
ncbi:hypothetical protein L596_011850 [Steinernema carpocapsae]|uniref:Uncharacterized protein n=1 Tax=Steinernema carpocapsae TaxID=34508 RepID=A0A4V6A4L7_STECR|nr:hypothetical protein L596_011850 [Steinernema carpocapsae]